MIFLYVDFRLLFLWGWRFFVVGVFFVVLFYMPAYTITQYTRDQAKRIGVTVKHSTNPEKKIDVFKDGKKIAAVGATGYNDYPTYMKKNGKEYADRRRKMYKMRHEKDRHERWTNGWLADQLLW